MSILLKGGTVILHGDDDTLTARDADVLIRNDTIVGMETCITAVPGGCEVIDCSGKIISPGFVDTHRHMWETALKGLCEDLTCVQYFAQMFTSSHTFTPRDVFWGSLAGCLEAVDAGTTTVLDFAHMNFTPDHGKQALAGTVSSGIRSVFAFAPTVKLASTTEPALDQDFLPAWLLPTLEQLCKSRYTTRVTMGFGFDFYFLPKDTVLETFDKVRALGVQTVTSHWARFPGMQEESLPRLLRSYGLLDERMVLSHLGGATSDDAQLLTEARTFVAASPSVESTMGLGPPVCFRDDLAMDTVCALGVDSHHATSGSMVNEMRVALVAARGADAARRLAQGHMPRRVVRTAHDAYVMATMQGARALGMGASIGSLAVGKKADVVVFDKMSPAMMPAAQHDPVTAIVMHSSVSDVDTVIVDGVVRKRNGRLLPVRGVDWRDDVSDFNEAQDVSWDQVASSVLDTQTRFLEDQPGHNLPGIQTLVRKLYNIP